MKLSGPSSTNFAGFELEENSDKSLISCALQELYATDPLVPIKDRSAPKFKLKPALRAMRRAAHRSGYQRVTPDGTLRSASHEPEGSGEADRAREVFARRSEVGKPTELVVADWPSPQGRFHPFRDISPPKTLPAASPYLTGLSVPEDYSNGSRQSGGASSAGDNAAGGRVVLPFYDPVRDLSGWQFGFPFTSEAGPGDTALHGRPFGSRILTRSGKVMQVGSLSLRPNACRPPEPVWAWAPRPWFEGASEFHLRPPNPNSESTIRHLEDLRREVFYTPTGLSREAAQKASVDLASDILVPGASEGNHPIRLGSFQACVAVVEDEKVLSIRPGPVARRMGLWTSHLTALTLSALVGGEPL